MTFTKTLSGDLKQLFRSARSAMRRNGGTISGDERSGEFTGKTPLGSIGGTYRVAGRVLRVTIGRKPALVSERRLRDTVERCFTSCQGA